MILEVFVVFDHKARGFGKPFYEVRPEMAVRSMRAAMLDPEQLFGKFPEDFDLYRLGKYDDATGLFELAEQPQLVCKCVQLKGGN